MRTTVLTLTLLAVCVALFAVPADSKSAGRALATGVTTVATAPQGQVAFDRIRDAGASFTRVIIYWSRVAPSVEPEAWDPEDPSDPNYDWTRYDTQIEEAVAAGLNPLVQVYSAPAWAERCVRDIPGICNPDPDDFARFSKAVAERYSGDFGDLPRVRYWQPWNEPNLFLFFEPQYKGGKKVSPDRYRELLNRFANVVKGVKSNNLVVGGGLAPLERPGGLGPLDFARRLLCMKNRNNPVRKPGCTDRARFDIWSNNPYTTGGPTHESAGADDVSLGDLSKMSKLLKAARKAGRIVTDSKSVPFWVTEFAWDSKGPDPGGVPMKRLSRWTAEAMYRAWSAGVSKFFWFSLRDFPRTEGLPYSQTYESGLYFRANTIKNDRPKKTLKAFRFPQVAFAKPRRRKVLVWGRTPTSKSGVVRLSYKKGGKWKRLGTARADKNGVFRKSIRSAVGKKKQGSVRAEYRGKISVPFSLKPVPDYFQPPFGRQQ